MTWQSLDLEQWNKPYLIVETLVSSKGVESEIIAEFDTFEDAKTRAENLQQVSPFTYKVIPNPSSKS